MLDWGKHIAVAGRFQYKAKWQDREDLRQDIILRLAQVARNNGHKPFTDIAMLRIASCRVADYWWSCIAGSIKHFSQQWFNRQPQWKYDEA